MRWFRADLHIHSVLSPCGDLDMSPVRIIHEAKNKKLDIIGISDHNSTKHAALMVELGEKNGIVVFPGAEINTREEVHCLTLFENIGKTNIFQEFIDKHLLNLKNDPEKLGFQLIVNEQEEIIAEEEIILRTALASSIEETEAEVHRLGGVFIPAHIFRGTNGILSQLGFIPETLKADALELRPVDLKEEKISQRPGLKKFQHITNSDAHFLHQIGTSVTEYYIETPSFEEFRLALANVGGRKVRIV